ncbi:TerD family protein [Pseudarthrobacter sp. DSP2-3-2b1]|uniref:TerD family protein n=1 Tax=Pseudarthrobacter sp. DSP2-3-2b1 TaxID=2804661 RepID=UPI003CF14FC8
MVPGSNAALTAENPSLRKVLVGFGWTITRSLGPQAELVPMAIMCGLNGQALSDEHLVFFNQLTTPDGSMEFSGREDQEQIDVDLPNVPEAVHKIAFVVYVDPDLRGPGNFSAVKSSYVRLVDETNRELLRFDVPSGNQVQVRAMLFGELYRHGGGWKFRAIGQGYQNGLAGVAADYKVSL